MAAVQENHPAVIQSTLALVLTSDQDEGLRVFYGISTLLLFSNYPPQMGSQGLRDQMNDSQIRELDFFFLTSSLSLPVFVSSLRTVHVG